MKDPFNIPTVLRAQEALACSLFAEAQHDLDQALELLAALEIGDIPGERLSPVGAAAERTYLALLP